MEEALTQSGPMHRTVDAGRGTAWWRESWALFMKNPVIWLVYGIIFCIGLAVLGLIPVLGGLVSALISQVVVGGWMMAARKLESGGTLEVADLFSGFKDKMNPLIVLGVFALIATLAIVLVMALIGGGAVLGMMAGGAAGSGRGMLASFGVGMFALLVGLLLFLVFAMAFWYAPALIVFRNMQPMEAVKASWNGTLANIVPVIVYDVIWFFAAIVASIPFGLGFFVLLPLTMLGMYCSYKDIFEGQ